VTLVPFNGLHELPGHSQASTRTHPHFSASSSSLQQVAPNAYHRYGPPPAEPVRPIRGYKAPMIIAAMFSVQQNVPQSISKYTLVQLECEVPLRPVRPHEKYAGLYTPHGIADEANVPGFAGYASGTADRSRSSVIQPSVGVAPHESSMPSSSAEPIQANGQATSAVSIQSLDNQSGNVLTGMEVKEEERTIDGTAQIPSLRPLPPDFCEERNSWYPRSRYCYHPAEYDPGQVLPGPGVMDLEYEEEMVPREGFRTEA
jgi:hypothetical protein